MRDIGSKKNKLIICVESFSYGTEKSHWPRIVSDFYDSKLVNLAIVGCSNFAICFQIERAREIADENDLVIISLTSADRFEIDDDEFNSPAELEDFRQNIDEIKNRIYINIYNNLEGILKSKGTERSIRNFIRCFGIDDEYRQVKHLQPFLEEIL